MPRSPFALAVSLLCTLALPSIPCEARRPAREVLSPLAVVDSVRPNSPASEAGLREGDKVVRLRGQRKPDLEEVLAYQFDWQNARETDLVVRREGRKVPLLLRQGDWGCEFRPDFSSEGQSRLTNLRKERGEAGEEALAEWGRWASAMEGGGDRAASAWIRREWARACIRRQQLPFADEAYATLSEAVPETSFWRFLAILSRAKVVERSGKLEEAAHLFSQATAIARKSGGNLRVASALGEQRTFEWHRDGLDAARQYGRESLTILESEVPGTLAVSESLRGLGDVVAGLNEFGEAETLLRRAVEVSGQVAPGTLEEASCLTSLGAMESQRGHLSEARVLHERALAIRESVSPGSAEVAWSLNSLGIVADEQGDPKGARAYYTRALEIVHARSPGGMNEAACLNNLGAVAWAEGDLFSCRDYFGKALEIRERLVPDGSEVAVSLNNLAAVAWTIGDLATARRLYLRSLAIRERLVPDSLMVASALGNLGAVARSAGDIQAAKQSYLRSLAITEKLAPGTMYVAMDLANLGVIAGDEGDSEAARNYQERALALKEKNAPESLEVAMSLANLSLLHRERGEYALARELGTRALSLRSKLAPGGLDVASSLWNMGELARKEGNLDEALSFHQRAYEIRKLLAPASYDTAESVRSLGALRRSAGDSEGALTLFGQAVDVLESQRSMLGGEAAKTSFTAATGSFYTDLLAAQLDSGQPESALETLERSRARALLEVLASRALDLSGELPVAFLDRQRALAKRRTELSAILSAADENSDVREVEAARAELLLLPQREDALAEEIRRASPRLAALEYPEPLAYGDILAALEPGTLLLAYAVAQEESFLFCLAPGAKTPLRVERIPVGRRGLSARVGALRASLDPSAAAGDGWRAPARGLYATLLGPFAQEIAQADRLLIMPDGPLNALPFSALLPTGRALPLGLDRRPLGVQRPLSLVPSLTVNAELVRRATEGGEPAPTRWVGFGDPGRTESGEGGGGGAGPEDGQARSRGLVPLPGARREVRAVATLFGAGGRPFLGKQATEVAAREGVKGVRLLHFACHGLLDTEWPMNSALALAAESAADGEGAVGDHGSDGLLQAWEILQELRLDADCVVLSACETGVGKDIGGEGVLGLTRAFFYAGARSVVVSLWPISDDSTAPFMEAFYREVLEGSPRDVALQKARAEVAADPRFGHPSHWAAFQLHGRAD